MPTLLLVRHGRTTANASGTLAGRMPGVHLDDVGTEQAHSARDRIGSTPLARMVVSPMERCRETAEILSGPTPDYPVVAEDRLTECDYGSWQGSRLADLRDDPLWKVVQGQPSAARFPSGESLPEMAARAIAAARAHDAEVRAEHGADAVWVAVSHGDVIKALLADASGAHLDNFQRFVVDPGSISIVHYTPERTFVLGINTRAGLLDWLVRPEARPDGEAAVGGGAGS